MAQGSTRLHFPIREAAKDKQLDCRIPHIAIHVTRTHNMQVCAVQHGSWGNKLLVEVQAVLLVRQMSHLQNISKANVSTKVLSKTYIRSYHTCVCIKKVMWGLVAAGQLWLSGYPVLRLRETSLRWGSAHESTNHHINTPLWIHSRLLTRRPSIAITLVLSILEYPL